jgi:threonine aldolase
VHDLVSMNAVHGVAARHGLPVHLDGARLWNAAAATDTAEREFAACADTVMVTLSKGLGCPAGSLLAGTATLIERARIVRRRWGGAMRQIGILAAAGLHALDHHRDRLADDHRRARRLAELCAGIDGLRVTPPETNIVMLELTRPGMTAPVVVQRLAGEGVLLVEFTLTKLRAVTHLDVDDDGIERAAAALRTVTED